MRRWQVELLAEELVPLYATEMLDRLSISMAPWLEQPTRMRLIRQLERLAGDDEREPIEVIEHDPVKAAEWLRSHGWLTDPVKSA